MIGRSFKSLLYKFGNKVEAILPSILVPIALGIGAILGLISMVIIVGCLYVCIDTGLKKIAMRTRSQKLELGLYSKDVFLYNKLSRFLLPSTPAHLKPVNKTSDLIHNAKKNIMITFIGHSTFLIQLPIIIDPTTSEIRMLNILTDPVFSKSLFHGVIERLEPPGVDINNLPNIDIILISHAHEDHLDFNSLAQIINNQYSCPNFLIEEGMRSSFIDVLKGTRGFDESKVVGLSNPGYTSESLGRIDENNQKIIEGVRFTCVPSANHLSGRIGDRNLWGTASGWLVSEPNNPTCEARKGKTIYFAGDTGQDNTLFHEIGQYVRSDMTDKFGGQQIDYALLPIGAHTLSHGRAYHHMNPEEAVEAFNALKANVMIPMHIMETFNMTGDGDNAEINLRRLDRCLKLPGNEGAKIRLLHIGETMQYTPTELLASKPKRGKIPSLEQIL